ncbi:hypothetical protein [Kribbella sp. NPDC051620]|uniref:hypothetical protein n=1 Tax=Kribbella sp. NPDC051620 TaxID=3364120 RepID=UPI0037A0AE18
MTALALAATTVVGTAGTTGLDLVRTTVAVTTVMTVRLRVGTAVVGLTVGRLVRTVVGTAAMSVRRRVGMSGVGTAGMSAVRLGGTSVVDAMSVLRLVGTTVVGIRAGLGLGLLGMDDRPASRVALGLGRGVMTGRGLCRVGTSGPATRMRLRGMIVDRVGTTATGLAAKSVEAVAGPIVSVAVGVSGVRTRRGSARGRTIPSFRQGSPVRSSTRG